MKITRKKALRNIGLGLLGIGGGGSLWATSPSPSLAKNLPQHHSLKTASLAELIKKLNAITPRRDFKTVDIVLTKKEDWDSESLELILGYQGGHKQMWDNTALDAFSWLNLMRESLNAQVYAFCHDDFFQVATIHSLAHVWLFDDYVWDKYQLGAILTEGRYHENIYARESGASHLAKNDLQSQDGFYSINNNTIVAMQKRGAFFLACHDSIYVYARKLLQRGVNPDHKSIDEVMAELTNHLISGAVLTPSIVGFIPELQASGYTYVHG